MPIVAGVADRECTDGRLFAERRTRIAVEAIVVTLGAWVWSLAVYRAWDMSPDVPFAEGSDGRLIANIVKNTADHGWWTTNPDLGYPLGQQLYDFPHGGETAQMLVLRTLTLFTDDPGLLINLYFFLGSGLAALASHLALRHLRFGMGTSFIGAMAMVVLPFRGAQGQHHLFRSSIWWVPLAIVVIVWVIHWRERFLIDSTAQSRQSPMATATWTLRHNLRRRRLAGMATMVAVLGLAETMTTAFTLTLLALTGIVAAIRRRDVATLAVHGLAILALTVIFVLGLTSSLRFFAAHGRNTTAAARVPIEQEFYGLKISELLLPHAGHRSELLAGPAQSIREASRNRSEAGQAIGLLGTIGFLGAAGHVLTNGWGRRGHDAKSIHDRPALRSDAGFLVVTATLMATISGGAIILSVLGLTQVRVWNRMSPLIGFCAVVFTLTLLEQGWAWVSRRTGAATSPRLERGRSGLAVLLVSVLLATVIWDGYHVRFADAETGRGVDRPATEAAWAADRAFARAIDDAMPDGSAVFQFPIVRFPEAPPPGRMVDYDHLRPFIHLPPGRLRWSYGAMKGRPDGDWQLIVRERMTEVEALPYLLGLGFDALWVDTWGYDDDGARLRVQLDEATETEPLVSAGGRWLFYDLRPLRSSLISAGTTIEQLEAAAQALLHVPPGR